MVVVMPMIMDLAVMMVSEVNGFMLRPILRLPVVGRRPAVLNQNPWLLKVIRKFF